MNFKNILLLFCGFLSVEFSFGQQHTLKSVMAGRNPISAPNTLTSASTEAARRNTGQKFTNAANVCAYGMWALYSETDYGEGLELTTTVTSVRGFETGGTCASSSTYPQLKKVKSAQFLGNTDPAANGMDIYSEKNFLGASVKITALPNAGVITKFTPISAIRLGSLAITGQGKWRICSDVDCLVTVVCIDMTKQRGGLYMNRIVPDDKSIAWPTYVRAYTQASDADCENDVRPPENTAMAARSVSSSNLDIFSG